MRDAQGEEFKHFCMDLEFLLRRTPLWREIARGILFQEGDIVEHGEEAEEEADRGRSRAWRAAVRRRVARHRRPEGGRRMSHLLREHAPISQAGWDLIDEEARERLTPALAARKLVDFAGPQGLAGIGHQPRPHEGLERSSGQGPCGRTAPRAPAGGAAGAVRDRPLRAA